MINPLPRLGAAGAALALVSLAPSAPAQQTIVIDGPGVAIAGAPGLTGPGRAASVTPDQLDRYAGLLGLDDAQRPMIKELHQGLSLELARLAETRRAQIAQLREEFAESNDVAVFTEKMPELVAGLTEERRGLIDAFYQDVQLVLTPDQEAAWPKVERARLRDEQLGRARMSGASVDLIALVNRVGLAPASRAQAQPTLDEYEIALDKALRERVELDEAGGGGFALLGGHGRDMASFTENLEKRRKASLELRKINERYLGRILLVAGPEEAEALKDAFQRASFPQVYGRSRAAEALAVAEVFDDLTPAQHEAVERIRERYEANADRVNRRWAEEIRKAEDDGAFSSAGVMGGDGVEIAASFSMAGDDPTDLQEAAAERRDLDARAIDDLKGVLNEAQLARLPQPRRLRLGPGGESVDVNIIRGPGGGQGVFFSRTVVDDGERRLETVEVGGVGDDAGEEEVEVIVEPNADEPQPSSDG